MVKISSLRNNAVKTTIPSLAGSEITIANDLSAGDFEKVVSNDNENKFLTLALSKMIIDWNLEDDNGNKLPINIDNISKLPVFDLKELFYQTEFGKRSEALVQKIMK